MKDNPNPGRRDALKTIVMGAGGLTIIGQAQPARAAAPSAAEAAEVQAVWKPLFFDEHQNETLITLTDLIIPATDTPGAKAALVNRYIDLLYNEEKPETQKQLIDGLGWLDGRSMSEYSQPFVRLAEAQQTAILKRLADPANSNPDDRRGIEFFHRIKELTLFGYYTSEIGLDQELQYGGDTYHTSFPGACTHPEHQS
ncbi:MAG TPA: gluconate 2-dehydrogenase subunit 3 family protein [Terriglobia bacterium]|nr:gluconate 2-dehydrogenase subunit 3 family protein [Terriglobia bacterium]